MCQCLSSTIACAHAGKKSFTHTQQSFSSLTRQAASLAGFSVSGRFVQGVFQHAGEDLR
jgi:hypothetical protein